jgi:hypothetical protein
VNVKQVKNSKWSHHLFPPDFFVIGGGLNNPDYIL